jgi:penicillin-binding protein 2
MPHVVLANVSDENAMAFELLSEQYDNVLHVEHSRHRQYPFRQQSVLIDRSTLPQPMRMFDAIEVSIDDVAELIVGDVRDEVWAEDLKKNPFRSNGDLHLTGYRVGDEVGNRGLEQSLEDSLRGSRGLVITHRDGEELSRTPVKGGEDVHVTLDIKLQARIEAALSPELGLMTVQDWHRNSVLPTGTPLRGAVVVLDVENSEVIAMASTPALRDEQDVDGYPWLNRAAEGLYPPGSIIKPLVLAAAITDEKLLVSDSIECVGHYFEHVKDAARCWIYRSQYEFRTHGKLKPVEAIARSCNIFFYELGSRLGFEKLIHWLQEFGMSQPLSSLLTNSTTDGKQGHLPSDEDIQELRNRGALAFETISVAIGQGALTWSPLHAAAAYATLARGGIWIPPVLVEGMAYRGEDLQLNQDGVAVALEGLHDSVSKQYGTGSTLRHGASNEEPIFNVHGVRLWGKTGTAEAPPYQLHHDSAPLLGLDHSWFLVMASSLNEASPEYVVAVLVEHGGSGGRVAGPIANQILHALQTERYLGGQR